MSRFKRAVIGFMVLANLGIYSAFALWLTVDGGLPAMPTIEVVAAMGAATDAAAPALVVPASPTASPMLAPAITPTPGWTPPANALPPLPTQRSATEAPPLEAAPTASDIPPSAATEPPPGLPIVSASLPPSARVEGVVGHRQALPLSCESRSAEIGRASCRGRG